jgi:hypothetical protein
MTIFLLFLATYRATRFITRDKLPLIDVPREAYVQRWGVYAEQQDKKLSINGKKTNVFMRSIAYLWECDWCTSVWVSGALVYALTFFVSMPLPWLTWGAVAAGVGLLAEVEGLISKKAQ